MIYYFFNYEINTDTQELLYKGKLKKIEPKVFKLLVFMLKNPDRVLSREELMSEVWGKQIISDSALSATICAARHAIGDSGSKQQCIKTVSGSGYRFIVEFSCNRNSKSINEIQLEPQLATSQDNIESSNTLPLITAFYYEKKPESFKLPDKPSIAIMDFIDIGATKKGGLFAYAMTADINASLARLSHFFVIARASSAVISKQNLLANEVGQRLGVRYLVYANTEYVGKRIQITLSIVDAMQNAEIWSEHFNHTVDDVFLLQRQITSTVVNAINSAIELAEIERAFKIPSENLSAWENYYRGLRHINSPTAKDIAVSQHYFQTAVEQDNQFSRAYAGLSYTHSSRILFDIAVDNDGDKASDYAWRSIDYSKHDEMGYVALARILWLEKKYQQALQVCEQGVRLNTGNFTCNALKIIILAVAGEDRQIPLLFEKNKRLNPFDPAHFTLYSAYAISLVNQQHYQQAAKTSLLAANNINAYFNTTAIATACHQLAGDSAKATYYAKQTLTLKPDYSTATYQRLTPHAKESTEDLLVDAMQCAGIPS